MCSQILWSTVNDLCFESITIFCLKLIEIVILWVYHTILFGLSLFLALFGHHFSTFLTAFLAKDP